MTSTFKLSALMAAIALTTACSSGGGGSDDSNDQANSRQIKGALIAPELPKQNAEALVARAFHAARYARASNTSSCSRSEEHTSELQSRENLVCRLLLEKKKTNR